ncbi:hypothetical protein I8J32_014180 [Lysobacter solisilvae]|uniref:DUF155 domain-containing protein n=1 Tax=Agrilutibacter solisilvae TaxID=2763317 RepID=A0A974Y6Y2_9GAMM|nr:hypothetical protein I8J32_014180 [Lysobacter solisilvae]
MRVRSGSLVAHRLWDVADTIDLARAERLWSSHEGREARRIQLGAAAARKLAFEVPPAQLLLSPVPLVLDGRPARAHASARLYDFGVIAIALRVDVADVEWAGFTAQCNALDHAVGATAQVDVWTPVLEAVLEVIAPAVRRPATHRLEEDYLFALVRSFDTPLTGAQVQERADLAALLSGETRPLSQQESSEVTAQSFSYFEDDLVVVTWDRAFVYEPRGDTDVTDILEVANAQLLEMRYYDELLDDELPTMYDLVENARGGLSLLASRRAARLARKLYSLVAEVTELTERVDNTLQVTEDVYLARIHTATLELFRVPKLSAAVDRKLSIIRETCVSLYEEAASRRAELLEVAIVLLIMFEIVLALVRH